MRKRIYWHPRPSAEIQAHPYILFLPGCSSTTRHNYFTFAFFHDDIRIQKELTWRQVYIYNYKYKYRYQVLQLWLAGTAFWRQKITTNRQLSSISATLPHYVTHVDVRSDLIRSLRDQFKPAVMTYGTFLPARRRRYASAGISRHRVSVCLSHAGIV